MAAIVESFRNCLQPGLDCRRSAVRHGSHACRVIIEVRSHRFDPRASTVGSFDRGLSFAEHARHVCIGLLQERRASMKVLRGRARGKMAPRQARDAHGGLPSLKLRRAGRLGARRKMPHPSIRLRQSCGGRVLRVRLIRLLYADPYVSRRSVRPFANPGRQTPRGRSSRNIRSAGPPALWRKSLPAPAGVRHPSARARRSSLLPARLRA